MRTLYKAFNATHGDAALGLRQAQLAVRDKATMASHMSRHTSGRDFSYPAVIPNAHSWLTRW
jgi:hypothetical protein